MAGVNGNNGQGGFGERYFELYSTTRICGSQTRNTSAQHSGRLLWGRTYNSHSSATNFDYHQRGELYYLPHQLMLDLLPGPAHCLYQIHLQHMLAAREIDGGDLCASISMRESGGMRWSVQGGN